MSQNTRVSEDPHVVAGYRQPVRYYGNTYARRMRNLRDPIGKIVRAMFRARALNTVATGSAS